jgi:hypothetical protein
MGLHGLLQEHLYFSGGIDHSTFQPYAGVHESNHYSLPSESTNEEPIQSSIPSDRSTITLATTAISMNGTLTAQRYGLEVGKCMAEPGIVPLAVEQEI